MTKTTNGTLRERRRQLARCIRAIITRRAISRADIATGGRGYGPASRTMRTIREAVRADWARKGSGGPGRWRLGTQEEADLVAAGLVAEAEVNAIMRRAEAVRS